MAVPHGLTEQSLWYPSATPPVSEGTTSNPDGHNIGLTFTVSADAEEIRAIVFYQYSGQTGTGTVALWRIDGGVDSLIESKSFTLAGTTGWQRVDLTTPYATSTSHGYVAHVWVPSVGGSHFYHYATIDVFDDADVVSSPKTYITGVRDNAATHANNFTQRNNLAANGTFYRPPSSYSGGYNFWVDVVVAGT
jgi:hypothetical protein